MNMNRREFLKLSALAGIAGVAAKSNAQQVAPGILFGAMADLDNAGRLQRIGYDFIEGTVSAFLMPKAGESEFAAQLEKLKSCKLPIRSCAGLLPGDFRLTGPDAKHGPALEYALKACERADAAGIPFIVLGSSGARNLPAGYDPVKGKAQFIDFCRKLGEGIKDRKVTIVLEPLNKKESNILNTVAEGIEYVDAVDRPKIRLLADIYHMLMENEAPEVIAKAGKRFCHCHIAERTGRLPPGSAGEDFRAYFKALAGINYAGGVSCECRWPKDNFEAAWTKALATLRRQSGVV